MTLEQYLKTYANGYNYDNAYGEQCVDWFRGYCKFVLEIDQPAGVKGAYQFWNNRLSDPILKNNFDAIENTTTAIPQYGDVVIWGIKLNGEFGHVAICVDKNATTSKFVSSDQNWDGKSTQANGTTTVPKLVLHNYNYVVGFLRPKDQNKVNGSQETTESTIMETENVNRFLSNIKDSRNDPASAKVKFEDMDSNDWDNLTGEFKQLRTDKNSLNAEKVDLKTKISEQSITIENLKGSVKDKDEAYSLLVSTVAESKEKLVTEYEKMLTDKDLTIAELTNKVKDLSEKEYTFSELLVKLLDKIKERLGL